MSENILVVEYEPRYTDRVRQALAGQPFTTTFARDGDEAMQALDAEQPRLIVLSSVVPKISTSDLIRAIRGRKPMQDTPILLTVSGYNGKSPKADAQRVGASDILPKPYSETEFLGKIQQMLGIRGDAAGATPQMTSNELFGDLLDEEKPVRRVTQSRPADVDKMLADTLGGMMPRKKDAAPAPAAVPQPPRAKTGSGDYDKQLSDTLSGIEKQARRTSSGTAPVPRPPADVVPPPPAAAARSQFDTDKLAAVAPDRVPISQPVFASAQEPARPEEDEPTDGVSFGQYVLIEKIATGGMAEVWKARMRGVEGFQKIVAIKKILPHLSDNQDFIEMFIDEAKLAAQLNHNNIIHIYDLGKIQSSYYIAMEYIDGFDLKTIIRRGQEVNQPMGIELALFVASKIGSALDYAHRKKDFEEREMGLVHRDVSPQNVLISQEGDIKLCDFGIAKAASKASHTQAGALKGKLQYMSPEQAWGRHVDRRSDVFALAAVLFEMLTGRKLFTGDNELSILEQVREASVTAPSAINDEVTPDIDMLVIKALDKDPAGRYQTAGEMARDIDAILYSYKPTPTSADLAIYMHRLSSPQAVITPHPEHVEAPVPTPAPVPVVPAPAPRVASHPAPAIHATAPAAVAAHPVHATPFAHHEPRKKPVGLIAAVLALVLGGGVAAVMLTRKPAPVTVAQPKARPAAAVAAPVPVQPATDTITDTSLTAETVTTGTTTALDASLVDQEVQRRLAAERARLEAQARAQQQAAQTTTQAPARPAPVQIAETQPPPVVTETRAPAPEPVAPPPAAAPAPQTTQPAAARAREGDLVAAGAEGLVAPRLVRREQVPYPPIARMQRAQGTVVTNVLVSETGAVLEVRIVRGISAKVGLNEAAQEMMRRSSFVPGTIDGVRVKSWVTVPVEFKL